MKTTKKIQALLFFGSSLLGTSISLAQTSTDNYIKAKKATAAIKGDLPSDVTQVSTSIGYHDGLGRPLQAVTYQGSPQKNDVVQPFSYDVYGRQIKKYLPFTNGNTGGIKQDPLGVISGYTSSPQYLYYNGGAAKTSADARPFSEAVLESSALNRPSQQFGPGQNWKDNNKYVGHYYEVNHTGDVLLFNYDPLTGFVSTGASGQASYYNAGQLTANRTTDEHGNEVIEYVDKIGHTVCKKVQYKIDTSGNKLYASTYYIYDDLGNLVVVLPPEAIRSALSTLTQN